MSSVRTVSLLVLLSFFQEEAQIKLVSSTCSDPPSRYRDECSRSESEWPRTDG